MGTRDLISGLFLIFVSLCTCIMAYRLGLGTGSNPGAGFAAFGIAFLLGILSMYLFFKALMQSFREGKEAEVAAGITWKKPMLILVILAAYGVFFDFLGFPLATFLLIMSLVWVFGRQRFPMALSVSILAVASSYSLFVMALGLPLPMGSLWSLVGR